MEFQNWKQDPRLRSMDPDKIKQMEQLADQARNTPQDKLLPLLMSLRGSNGSPQFSTSEMDTLFFDPDRPNAPSAETAGGNAADAEPADGRGK